MILNAFVGFRGRESPNTRSIRGVDAMAEAGNRPMAGLYWVWSARIRGNMPEWSTYTHPESVAPMLPVASIDVWRVSWKMARIPDSPGGGVFGEIIAIDLQSSGQNECKFGVNSCKKGVNLSCF